MQKIIIRTLIGITVASALLAVVAINVKIHSTVHVDTAFADGDGGGEGGGGEGGGGGDGGGEGGGGEGGGGGDGGGEGGGGVAGDGCCGDAGTGDAGPGDAGPGGESGEGGNNGGDIPPTPPTPPTPVWTAYCTGAPSFQWWEYDNSNPTNYRYMRPGDGACVPPAPVWTPYCTGAGNTNPANDWQWWEYDNSNPTNYRYMRPGDGACVPPATPVPSCTITASLTSVLQGGSYTLSWNTTNVSAANINNGIGAVAASGSRVITAGAPGTYIYTLTVGGYSQYANCQATVVVTTETVVNPFPVCTISANPTSVTAGGASTLSWTTTNATFASIDHGVGAVAIPAGSVAVTPSGTTVYTMTVTNGSLTADCAATITVVSGPVAPVCTLSIAPGSVFRGDTATLTWTTSNALSVSIDQGVGAVAVNGAQSVIPVATTTYTLTAIGTNNQQVVCTAPIVVQERPVNRPFTCENNVNFSASPTSISRGNSSTLGWSVTGATAVTIDNGVVTNNALSGSASVSPSSNTTYTLTAVNGPSTINCPVTVTVESGGGGGGGSSLRCELTASDKTINRGDKVTLTWKTTNATSLTLKDSLKKTIVTTADKSAKEKKDLLDDSIVVRPDRDTTYTLKATRGSRDRDCVVKIDVKDDSITEVRDQDLVVSIPLTDVPYTGFDAKTIMQTSVLGGLGLYGAYLGLMLRRRDQVAIKTR